MSPRDVIARIRREEYLLDIEVTADINKGLENIRAEKARTNQIIAEDIYSKQTHFVLELVQNADDNRYGSNVVPSLSFQIAPNKLVVTNNDTGFDEADVLSLCRTGASTKKAKEGAIGEKGIGFKSVFSVSDKPEIHSNGYHFKFDRSVGITVPIWLDPARTTNAGVTTIVLPAKPGFTFTPSALGELNAQVLLFLGKVRELEVIAPEYVFGYARQDKNAVTILSTKVSTQQGVSEVTIERFVRFSKTLSMHGFADDRRKGHKDSTLSLAFPMNADGNASPEPTCHTFAYLPVRAFGFSFCIHGDFLLSASREDVHADRQWNIRLRDNIATTFVAALAEFKKMPALALTYLKFLPAERDVSDPFFKPVVAQLFTELKQGECIPSASGKWRKPTEILLVKPEIRELFTSADALRLFGLDFHDERLEVPPDGKVLETLGCRWLTYVDLVDIFVQHGDWLRKKPKSWLAQFYAYLSRLDLTQFTKYGLLSAPCVPTRSGAFAAPEQGSLFYPLSDEQLYGFENELTIVDPEIITTAASKSDRVHLFFDHLGIKRDDPYELIVGHILSRHAGDEWKNSENDALMGHVRYVKDKLSVYLLGAVARGKTEQDALALLGGTLMIGTKEETETWIFDHAATLYLGKEFKPIFCIETHLPNGIAADALVSPKYLQIHSTKENERILEAETALWRDFLLRIGVREAPKLDGLSDGDAKMSLEMASLAGSPQAGTRRALLECIGRNWRLFAGHIQYPAKSGKSYLLAETQFIKSLQAMIAPTRQRATAMLSDSFLSTPEIRAVLGDAPVYVDADISGYAELLKETRITVRLNAAACLKRLKQLKAGGAENSTQLRKIYRQLDVLSEKEGASIKQECILHGLIRLKGDQPSWVQPSEVTWRSSNSPFLDSIYPPLENQYKDFSSFFVNKLGVAKELSTSKIVAALPKLALIATVDERAREAATIYKRMNRDIAPKFGQLKLNQPEWLEDIENKEIFLNQRGELVANDDALFIDDWPEVAELFSNVDGISMLSVHPSSVRHLIGALGIHSLSESATIEVVSKGDFVVNLPITTKARSIFSGIARSIYHRGADTFEDAYLEGRFAQLRQIEIVEAAEIELEVTLGEHRRRMQTDIALSGARVIVKTDTSSLKDRVAIQICKLIKAPPDVADIISRLLMENDLQSVEDYLRVKNIGLLPANEEAMLAIGHSENGTQSTPDDDSELDQTEASVQISTENPSIQNDDQAAPAHTDVTPIGSNTGPVKANGATPDQRVPASTLPTPVLLGGRPFSSTIQRPKESSHPSASGQPPGSSAANGRGTFQPQEAQASSSPTAPLREPIASTPPTGARNNRHKPTPSRTKSGRLLSYADSPRGDHPKDGSSDDQHSSAARDEIAQAAVTFFLSTQIARWKTLEEMPPFNPGFDVCAVAHDGSKEFIEVKGQSGAWTEAGVALTPTELSCADRMRDKYWLCVVEFATDENRRRLYLVPNPYGSTQQFRFDSGWKSQAITGSAQPTKPDAGLRIDIADEGAGTIVSATKKGQFYKLHVQLNDGRQLFSKTFNPATMKLSTG